MPNSRTDSRPHNGRETKVLALTIPERETILAALEDAPADLVELRGVLLRDLE